MLIARLCLSTSNLTQDFPKLYTNCRLLAHNCIITLSLSISYLWVHQTLHVLNLHIFKAGITFILETTQLLPFTPKDRALAFTWCPIQWIESSVISPYICIATQTSSAGSIIFGDHPSYDNWREVEGIWILIRVGIKIVFFTS